MLQTEQSTNGASDRKIEANRANAQKSTGPRTEIGRQRSSQNARRHDLLSSAATLMAQPNQLLQNLVTGYIAKLQPGDVQEEMLVREAAVADYRIQQIDHMESGLLAYQMQTAYNQIVHRDKLQQFAVRPVACQRCGAPPPVDKTAEPEPEPPELSESNEDTRTLMMGAAWVTALPAFALLFRYRGQAHRDYYKALKQLELLRTGKAGYLPQEQAAVSQPEPAETNPPPLQTNPTPPDPPAEPQPSAAQPAAPAPIVSKSVSETNPTWTESELALLAEGREAARRALSFLPERLAKYFTVA